MEFGSQEWFAMVDKNYKFPVTVAFYVSNKNKPYSKLVDTKAENVRNIKYDKLQGAYLDDNEVLALYKVKRLLNANEYYEATKELKNSWNII